MPHPDVAVPSLPLSETLALAIKLGVANVDFEEQAEIDCFLYTFGNACYEVGRAAGRASAEPEGFVLPVDRNRDTIFKAAKACAAHAFDQPIDNSPSQRFWQAHADNLNRIVDEMDSAAAPNPANSLDWEAICAHAKLQGFDAVTVAAVERLLKSCCAYAAILQRQTSPLR